MTCPAEGGIITAQETFWEAWGTQALTNLGHISNFAFGFLVGRGGASMVAEAGTAAAGASSAGQAATTFARTFGKSFLNTAKENFVQQFTGWNQGGMFCRFMKGFGLYGEVKAHYDIWTDEEMSTWEKIKASGMSLILDVFAAKGATTVCFPAGTKVHTQWGLADIEKLEVGVPVLTYNEETGEQEYKKVKKVMRRMTRRMCALELSNGTTLEVTPEHRFFSNGEWTPIEELNVNDTLQLKDNSIVVIENKIIFPTFVEVYNLEIEDNENYYVTEEGVLVHNGYKDKPKNSPDPKKWKEKGGTIKVSDDGKVWEYTDWEGNTVKYKDGYPDFSPHERQHVDIDMKGNRTSDFTEANNKAPKGKKLPENTWHHNENGTTMQEVPTDIHRRFTHRGGVSILKNN